jgi:hypothetical protein
MNSLKEKFTDTIDGIATQPIQEGRLTKRIENQTAKIPSVFFLNLALGSIALSAGLRFLNKKSNSAPFVGLWVPTILLLGIYNKLVKIEGNDRYSRT